MTGALLAAIALTLYLAQAWMLAHKSEDHSR